MSRRLRRSDNPFSLFAFQDIITAVTGILILITLILALSLNSDPLDESPEQKKDLQAMQAEVASLASDLSRFKDQVDSDAVIINLMAKHGASDATQLIAILEEALADAKQLSVANRESTDSAKATADSVASENKDKQTNLEQLLEMIADDAALLESLTTNNRMIFEFKTDGREQPWIIECRPDVWLAGSPNFPGPPVAFKQQTLSGRLAAFELWAAQLPERQQYFVIVVKPGAVDSFRTIRASTQLENITFGTDLIPLEVTVVDPEMGVTIQ